MALTRALNIRSSCVGENDYAGLVTTLHTSGANHPLSGSGFVTQIELQTKDHIPRNSDAGHWNQLGNCRIHRREQPNKRSSTPSRISAWMENGNRM